jgi:hypothetical protein
MLACVQAWLAALVLVGALGARPYEDTKQRFSLEVPEAWRLAPRFGDLAGMTFERRLEALGARDVAVLTVHVDPLAASHLDEFVRRVEADEGATGPAEERAATVAGRPARVRERKVGERVVRGYFFDARGRYFHLRLEVPELTLRAVEAELAPMLASFTPGVGGGKAPAFGGGADTAPAASSPSAPAARPVSRGGSRAIVGRWRSPSGARLELGADGRFRMGSRQGTYSLSASQLVLDVPGKDPITLAWSLADEGRALTISGEALREPARYRRDDDAERGLAGRWIATRGRVELDLGADGHFTFGPLEGTWSEAEDHIVLRSARGDSVTYRATLDDDTLQLSGGDLEQPLVLRRR